MQGSTACRLDRIRRTKNGSDSSTISEPASKTNHGSQFPSDCGDRRFPRSIAPLVRVASILPPLNSSRLDYPITILVLLRSPNFRSCAATHEDQQHCQQQHAHVFFTPRFALSLLFVSLPCPTVRPFSPARPDLVIMPTCAPCCAYPRSLPRSSLLDFCLAEPCNSVGAEEQIVASEIEMRELSSRSRVKGDRGGRDQSQA